MQMREKKPKRGTEARDDLRSRPNKGITLLPPPTRCHGFPGVDLDVRTVVLIEAFSWPTVKATDPKGLLNTEVLLVSDAQMLIERSLSTRRRLLVRRGIGTCKL